MHGLNTIVALNEREQKRQELLAELVDNRALLEKAPKLTANERMILHYSKVLQRLAAGETFEHVAADAGPAWFVK